MNQGTKEQSWLHDILALVISTEHGCNEGIKREVSLYETQLQVADRCGVSSVVIN